MIVSLVSGTYNRIQFLSSMVQSFRNSIGLGILYEIIIVDGGSTDGTIEWCQIQPDIRLIEQGELLGAVKAFNAGAYAATGKYVLLGNDDILFHDESVIRAIVYMEDHPDCGIGCFYQDRGGKTFHVEQMPAIRNGKQTSVYYGQVCLVRKFLGDEVGWWGNYLHTYGGDNELSCNVLELGWTVDPIECACISDLTPNDGLRKKNNEVAKVGHGNNHPDTQKWLDKWTKDGKVGPNIPNNLLSVDNRDKVLRFLYLPIYEYKNMIQHKTKRGLRDALSEIGIVYELDYVDAMESKSKQYFKAYFEDMLDVLKPDIILTQMHDAKAITIGDLYDFKKLSGNAKWVNWNGDYHPEHLYDPSYVMFLKLFDLSGFVTTSVKTKYDLQNISWFYWQIGYEGEDILNVNGVKKHDIVFLANGYSKDRLELGKRLRGLTEYNVGLYGFWPKELKPDGENVYDFSFGYKLYRNAKVAISDAQWPNVTGYCSNRLFQALFSGVCLFQQRFDGMEILGLEHGVNCIVWENLEELEHMLNVGYPDIMDGEFEEIGMNGKILAEEKHSFDIRVDELLKELERRGLL